MLDGSRCARCSSATLVLVLLLVVLVLVVTSVATPPVGRPRQGAAGAETSRGWFDGIILYYCSSCILLVPVLQVPPPPLFLAASDTFRPVAELRWCDLCEQAGTFVRSFFFFFFVGVGLGGLVRRGRL